MRACSVDNRARLPWLAVLLALGALPSAAAAQEAASRLTLLTPCGGAAPTEDEERLRAELELALDGFDVVVVDPGRADFRALGEQEQIEVIRAATSNAADTSPVLWLECGIPGQPVVRLLITDGGAGFVRVLSGGSFGEIALIVRELVLAPPPPPPPEPPPPAEDEPPAEEPPAEEPPAEEPPWITVGILTAVELGGGLVGHVGASFLGGVGVGLDAHLELGFFGRLVLLGKFGPRSEEGEFLIVGQRFEPRVELGYVWEIGSFAAGPVVGLAPFLSFIDFVMADRAAVDRAGSDGRVLAEQAVLPAFVERDPVRDPDHGSGRDAGSDCYNMSGPRAKTGRFGAAGTNER
jgi:hypothetical protein